MAGFTDTLRGDGLARAQRALAGLEGDPLRLEVARTRFSHSPPPYTSDRSGTTTQSASPEPPSEQQRRKRRVQLGLEREASTPYHQLQTQTIEEEKRVFEADLNGTHRLPIGSNTNKIADENVKNRWVEQGIWNNKWNKKGSGRWKHEEPLEVESESETDSEAPTSLFSLPQPKPRRPKSDEEKQRIAERRVVREREREASRPYFQFVYQISKERERIQDESRLEESVTTADINSRAYESVKATWTKRGIWNRNWGILPGVSWKHEEPLEEAVNGFIPASADLRGNAQLLFSHEAVEGLSRRISGSPSPVEPNQPRESGIANTSQQGPPMSVDSVDLGNGDAEHTPSASYSPHTKINGQVLRPIIGQGPRRSNRIPSQKAKPVVTGSLGPVHASKVSKPARKTQLRPQRRPNVSKKVSFGSLPLSSDMDTAEPQPSPVQVTTRRSKRIQPPAPSVATNQPRTASTDPSKPTTRSKPKRDVAKNVTTRSTAKPQGISKKQPAKTPRGKATKD